jgi:hypothetical protein
MEEEYQKHHQASSVPCEWVHRLVLLFVALEFIVVYRHWLLSAEAIM